MAERSPAFQFYPRDFLSDVKQAAMTPTEAGVYIRLMCHCWIEGSIPSDMTILARLAGVSAFQLRQMWPAILPCFREGEDGRLSQPRLDKERDKQAVFRERAALGGLAKAAQAARKQPVSTARAPAQPLPNPALLSSSSSAISQRNISVPESLSVPDDVAQKAGRFLEHYPQIYAEERRGAHFQLKPVLHFMTACELVQGWPDERRLELMFRTFCQLPTSEKMAWPGTPAQFLHLAPEIDVRLRQEGA